MWQPQVTMLLWTGSQSVLVMVLMVLLSWTSMRLVCAELLQTFDINCHNVLRDKQLHNLHMFVRYFIS